MRRPPFHRAQLASTAVWALRLLPVLVLVELWPDLRDWLTGAPGATEALAESSPVILGVGALRTLAAAFVITPLMTLLGWRWHVILRRDFGRWTFFLALLDLILAAATTDGGIVAGLAGHLFLALGTLATLLLLPLAVTSNVWSQKRLGRYWKRLHLLVYPILLVVVAHLLLLPDGPTSTIQVSWLFGPSLLLRVPVVRRWVVAQREALTSRVPQRTGAISWR